jgi:hypothetical protein
MTIKASMEVLGFGAFTSLGFCACETAAGGAGCILVHKDGMMIRNPASACQLEDLHG